MIWAQAPTKTPRPPAATGDLAAHGMGTTPAELVRFLESGLPSGLNRQNLPEKPAEKSQLAIDAMAQLAKLRSREALPVLTQIAVGQPPQGVAQLLDYDVARTSPEGRTEFRNKALRLLRFNAVNALGFIGDPQALPAVREAFRAERSSPARIQYALSMATLGDPAGIDFLVDVILQENRRESAAAAKAFYMITSQDFGYTENTALRARRTKARKYRDWWAENGKGFQPDPAAIIKRRTATVLPPEFEPRNTRDLLKLATYYTDFENKLGTRDARDRLAQSGKAINGDLQKIAMDPMEDLDVRMEAINWFFQANRTDSESFLKKLRRDENPEIVDRAESFLQQIEQDATSTPAVVQR